MYKLCYEQPIVPTMKSDYTPVIHNADSIYSAVKVLAKFQMNVDRILYVESAYQDFVFLKEETDTPTRQGQIALERRARSYFLEFEIFLDHWKKYIANHPRKEEFKTLFNQLTHDAFDTSDDYAMTIIIRNYVTHSAGIIQGTFWGSNNKVFEVGCSKDILLSDSTFNNTKKEIIKRQPAQFISLHPIMRGSLEKLKEIQDSLIRFQIDKEIINAANAVREAIEIIKKQGQQKHWFFIDENGPELMTVDKDGKPIEFIKGKYVEEFYWKDSEKLISTWLRQ